MSEFKKTMYKWLVMNEDGDVVNYGFEDEPIEMDVEKIRADFPGGWEGDKINAFSGEGLTDAQKDIQIYISKIQNWRKTKDVIHHGKLVHFVPEDGIYTYFRYNDNESVMVILNKNETDKVLTTNRFKEIVAGFKSGNDIISSTQINDISEINVPAKSAMIIELK